MCPMRPTTAHPRDSSTGTTTLSSWWRRAPLLITNEDDYTFGFSTDEGARLRIKEAAFTSSTELGGLNPARPAHRGDTLSFPGNTTLSDTLGVTHLKPGNYEVEFIQWEATGAPSAYFSPRAVLELPSAATSSFTPTQFAPVPGLMQDQARVSTAQRYRLTRDHFL